MSDVLAMADAVHLEWPALQQALAQALGSPAARARLEQERTQAAGGDESASSLFSLQGDLAACASRLVELDELESLQQRNPDLAHASLMARVEPIAAVLQRAARGLPLDVAELLAVGDALVAAVAWADALQHDPSKDREPPLPALRAALSSLQPPRPLTARLQRSIEPDGVDGEPALADGASETLARLREQVRRAKAALRTAAERLLRRPALADAFGDAYVTEREGRVVLPVRASAFSASGGPGTIGGIIHDASQSGQTLFVEPHELVDENNAVRHAQVAVRSEEQRVLAELSREVQRSADVIGDCVEALVRVDAMAARLALSRALGGITPVLLEPAADAVLELPDARHPLMLLRGREVVPNLLRVAHGTALVISGPNAGGKTVALKTIGLCVLLARVGVRLPTASPARVPLFRGIVTDVGDDQSIARDLSTFSAHIGHVRRACERARDDGEGTLVLLDEVAVGTDPDQGAALAEAIVRELVERRATAVVTTHYERLKLLSHGDARFVNAAVGFELATLSSTFRIHLGIPGNSSALAVARRLGLPTAVLDAAAALVDGGRADLDAVLVELAELREELRDRSLELRRESDAMTAARLRLEALERDESERASAKLAKAHQAAAAELRGLSAELRDARRALRRGADEAAIARVAGQIGDAASRLDASRPAAPSGPSAPKVVSTAVGDRVRVERLGLDGEVVAIKGDRVTVQLGSGRTTVARDELTVPSGGRPKPGPTRTGPAAVTLESDGARYFGAEARAVEPGVDNVVDLRGVRADEALALLESQLARAIEDDTELVIVRHGHGSGALRKAVREHLPSLPHVARHRPGLPAEGGDAVTVVWVRG
ncbi:MAG: Smr/MutS family protein [Deltaproteobacteria bacterium]|nr:Smr/MutS family protein [Deltaproteobacteria bacterium]MBK8718905.1 Smr/MutS family protein [Deltaproteobacteria bacterium]MBP7289190.1 Smr/MutS family protein [Nannocystaceae bacterium]